MNHRAAPDNTCREEVIMKRVALALLLPAIAVGAPLPEQAPGAAAPPAVAPSPSDRLLDLQRRVDRLKEEVIHHGWVIKDFTDEVLRRHLLERRTRIVHRDRMG